MRPGRALLPGRSAISEWRWSSTDPLQDSGLRSAGVVFPLLCHGRPRWRTGAGSTPHRRSYALRAVSRGSSGLQPGLRFTANSVFVVMPDSANPVSRPEGAVGVRGGPLSAGHFALPGSCPDPLGRERPAFFLVGAPRSGRDPRWADHVAAVGTLTASATATTKVVGHVPFSRDPTWTCGSPVRVKEAERGKAGLGRGVFWLPARISPAFAQQHTGSVPRRTAAARRCRPSRPSCPAADRVQAHTTRCAR